jgi:Ser/Thr protein kinase RdoA (MazF antagonist)
MFDYKKLLAEFDIHKAQSCQRYGNGHINDTYVITTPTEKYVLQRINHKIFTNIEGLMRNQELVINHIEKKMKQDRDYDKRLLLSLVRTKDGNSFLPFEGNFYRLYEFIEGGVCLEKISNAFEFELSGRAFGRFQRLLDGFAANELYEVIPNFHNTVDRLQKFKTAIAEDAAGRKAHCQDIIDEYLARQSYAPRIVKMLNKGEIPTRVTHNDTKLNNVMIDLEARQPLAVLDLDTVMAGSIVYDFGDSIRFGANKGAEDERDLSKVGFDIELFKAFTRGFVEETRDVLTTAEINNLAFGAILLTYECGMRFLTDHLNGDTYFKIHREGHNLDRARTQLKMVQDMEVALPDMELFVRKFYV